MLEFQSEGHIYKFDGEVIPSVTQALEPLSGYVGVPKWLLAIAADRGTEVHTMCEYHDYGTLEEYNQGYQGYLDAWIRFLADSGFEVDLVELRLYHPAYKYAGQIDRIGSHRGKRGLLDIKTTAQLMPVVGPQTAAYEELFNINNKDQKLEFRWAVQLKPDGTYRRETLNDRTDLATFTSCLNLFRWKEKKHV